VFVAQEIQDDPGDGYAVDGCTHEHTRSAHPGDGYAVSEFLGLDEKRGGSEGRPGGKIYTSRSCVCSMKQQNNQGCTPGRFKSLDLFLHCNKCAYQNTDCTDLRNYGELYLAYHMSMIVGEKDIYTQES
jgi:hypothetical protein